MAKAATLPARHVPPPAKAKAPVQAPAPVTPTAEEAELQSLGRNVLYEIDGDTLHLYVNIGMDALRIAPMSKGAPGKANHVPNPVIASSKGFQYLSDVYNDKDLGIAVNVIAKDRR